MQGADFDGGNKYYVDQSNVDRKAMIYNMLFIIAAVLLAIGAIIHIFYNLSNEKVTAINLFEILYLIIFGAMFMNSK